MDTYEKKYKEALERARELSKSISGAQYDIIFPELKNDDERIREAIIATIHLYYGEPLEDEAKEMIAWLEKQSEQKPADKVEPKFHEGDWVVTDKCDTIQIVTANPGYYTLDNGMEFSTYYIDKYWHLWTIQDAKDGDVIYLPNGNNEYYFFIFKGIENAAVMSFAHFYQYNDGSSVVEGTIDDLCSVNDVFQPATKEQRDLLFEKIHEAGYEWDAEKKELKKIGQKPIEWSDEDEEMLKSIMATCELAEQERDSSPARHLLEMQLNWLKTIKQKIGG